VLDAQYSAQELKAGRKGLTNGTTVLIQILVACVENVGRATEYTTEPILQRYRGVPLQLAESRVAPTQRHASTFHKRLNIKQQVSPVQPALRALGQAKGVAIGQRVQACWLILARQQVLHVG
jgi:hypothetical protein